MPKMKSRTVIEPGRVVLLPLGEIHPNPSQPRRVFDPAGIWTSSRRRPASRG